MKTRILIVDDEPNVLDVLKQHLEIEGYECLASVSPIEALNLLREQPFDALLTDMLMPEMNGTEVVRRAKEAAPDLAVIVITVVLEVRRAIEAIRTGADDYVLKPFNLGEISLSLSKVLEKRRLVIENREHQEKLESRISLATHDLEDVNRELRETKEYLENLLHSTVDAIITTSTSGTIEFVNEGALHMLGHERGELVGMDVARLCAGGANEIAFIRRALQGCKPLQNYESELTRKDGGVVPVNMSLSPVRNADDQIVSVLAVCKDVTEQKRLEQQLKEMSIKDSLTGLYNHRNFFDRLEAEIERAKRQGHPLSILLLDIDQFKSYNDTHGHLEGDEVLKSMTKVLRESTREHVDVGFRYGGDEFTVILPEAGDDQALQIAERIRKGFEAQQFDNLTLSIGLMSYAEGVSLRSMVHFADSVMYEAKRSGGNRVCVHRQQAESPQGVPQHSDHP